MKLKTKIRKIKKSIKEAPLSAYVVFSITMIILFTITVIVLTTITDERYDTIYTVFISVFGGEILCASLIKIFKLKGDSEDE